MSLLHLTFDPTLSLWKNGDIDDWYSSGSTGDAAADAIIEHKLITDAIDFSHAYTSPQWEVYAYQFDPQARTIHLWVKNPTGGNITLEELKQALYIYGPDGGPDTWMEGDLDAVDDATAHRLGYDTIELTPEIQTAEWLLPTSVAGEYSAIPIDLAPLVR